MNLPPPGKIVCGAFIDAHGAAAVGDRTGAEASINGSTGLSADSDLFTGTQKRIRAA
jgi:hypothetical protein